MNFALEAVRGLLAFLMEDCCQGQPELCEPVLDTLIASCCAVNPTGETHETNAR